MDEGLDGYLRDESRTTGWAETISFPRTEEELVELMTWASLGGTDAVTVQGARTGLAAGAVPQGGHVVNLGSMNRVPGLSGDEAGNFSVTVQPGVVLQDLRRALESRRFDTEGWDQGSLDALEALGQVSPRFFPTDPTETSATIGGMVACNASGARSYRYGPMRRHVKGLRVVLPSGDIVDLKRGQVVSKDGVLSLPCESGAVVEVPVPTYAMPSVKNASGYFAQDPMDAVDLFVGSDGTLGIVSQVELELLPTPPITWGVNCFFMEEGQALDFVEAQDTHRQSLSAVEYFDGDALDILRSQRAHDAAFSSLPEVPKGVRACVYVEIVATDSEEADQALHGVVASMEDVGADPFLTWVGLSAQDRERQRFFRHAVPESVNMLIDGRRQEDPSITKLGSDMAVPAGKLHWVMDLYRRGLAEAGLQSAMWGHIGDNHLHVNVLPKDAADMEKGRALFASWAAAISAVGGTVSAEHGVGKVKRDFLAIMYGPEAIAQMVAVKEAVDPRFLMGRGNLFPVPAAHGQEGGGL